MLLGLVGPARGQASNYHLAKELPVEDGGCNVLCADGASRRLYAVSAANVSVVDIDKEEVVNQFTNITGVHAFSVVPRYKQALYLKGQEATLSAVDMNSFKRA